MSADILLSRLEAVKRTGDGRYVARCPAHADRRASLAVRDLGDGRVLAHCFAGCSIHEVVNAAGLTLSDLFPLRDTDGRPERRAFPAADVLRALSVETMIVGVAAADMAKNKRLKPDDLARLSLAAERILAAAEGFQ